MGWGNKFPDMKNDPTYLEGRVSNAETQLAQIMLQAFNVRTSPYNAKADGETDDTTAIQNAINDASVKGGIVFFPPGTYVIQPQTNVNSQSNSALVIANDNVALIGSGVGTTKLLYKAYGGADPTSAAFRTHAIRIQNPSNTGVHNLIFRDFEMDGNISTARNLTWDTHNKALYFADNSGASDNILIENCYIHNFQGEAVYNGGANSGRLLCRNTRLANSPASLATWGGSPIFDHCRFINAWCGIEQSVPVNGRFIARHCYFSDCTNQSGSQLSVVPQSTTDNSNTFVEVTDCYFDKVLNGGSYFSGVTVMCMGTTIIKGNTFVDAGIGPGYGHSAIRIINGTSNYPTLINDSATIEDNHFVADTLNVNGIHIDSGKPSASTYAVNNLIIKNNKSYSTSRGYTNSVKVTLFEYLAASVKNLTTEGNLADVFKGSGLSVPSSDNIITSMPVFPGYKQFRVVVNLPSSGNATITTMQTVSGTNYFDTIASFTAVSGDNVGIATIRVRPGAGTVYLRGSSNVTGTTVSFEMKEV